MKHDQKFLPLCIDIWGGIENFLSGNRAAMWQGKTRYWHNQSHVQLICSLLANRFARSGKFPVDKANALLWKACLRYSGAPDRSFRAAQLEGMGVVVISRHGQPVASLSSMQVSFKWRQALSSAVWCYSDIQTRRVALWDQWEACAKDAERQCFPFVRTDPSEACCFCGTPVESYRFTKKHYDYHCRKPECRHMAWLAHTKQSNGGIDLTPTQRKTTTHLLWDQVRVLNYLNAKAKQAGRKRNERHQAS